MLANLNDILNTPNLSGYSPNDQNSMPGRGYGRTMELFSLLADQQDGLAPAALAIRLKVPKSTLSLMIRHFREGGFVTVDRAQRVRPGPQLLSMAVRLLESFAVRRVARRHLQELARKTGHDAYLAVLSGLHVVNITKIEGADMVRLNIDLGESRPLHATASGKIFLAFSPRSLLEDFVRIEGLRRITPRTITSPERLRAELEAIRRNGYAVSDEEIFEGVCSYAVPVMDDGQAVAAVALSAVRVRALRERDTLLEQMLAAQVTIERDMGEAGLGFLAPEPNQSKAHSSRATG